MTDRDLDAKVAVEVMRWTLGPPHMIHGYMMHGMVEVECWEGSRKGDTEQTKESWHPSTDIAPAWKVWEHMKDDDGHWSRFVDRLVMGGYEITAPTCEQSLRDITPKAICLAALDAVKVKV